MPHRAFVSSPRFQLTVTNLENPVKPESVDTVLAYLETESPALSEIISKLKIIKELEQAPVTAQKVISYLRGHSSEADYALTVDGQSAHKCNWYNYFLDMLAVSRVFPDWCLELTGYGEEVIYNWRMYFINGKYQKCPGVIGFSPFDASLLRDG